MFAIDQELTDLENTPQWDILLQRKRINELEMQFTNMTLEQRGKLYELCHKYRNALDKKRLGRVV